MVGCEYEREGGHAGERPRGKERQDGERWSRGGGRVNGGRWMNGWGDGYMGG